MSEVQVSQTVSSGSESAGSSPGTILRRCREFHGITLEEASETTKIGITHLKALEDDRIREFANQAYLKGFLRIYATFLGLNSDDVARMYEKLFGVHGEKPDPTRSVSPPDPPRRWISLKKMVFPALLLAVIIITATFFKLPPPPLVRQTQPEAVDSVPPRPLAAVQLKQSSVRVKKTVQDIPPAKIEKRHAELPVEEKTVQVKHPSEGSKGPKGFILKAKVTRNGTMTATVDGDVSQQYELTIGDVIEWKAEKRVLLELSNAGGVDIELNGKPYKSLGPSGKPIYVEFDADGVKP